MSKHKHVLEFVNYNGKFPNLCCGKLIVKIDGKEFSFDSDHEDKSTYDSFWASSGCCSFNKEWGEILEKGPWKLMAFPDEYPEPIRSCLNELIDLFNENVEQGCCGGCI